MPEPTIALTLVAAPFVALAVKMAYSRWAPVGISSPDMAAEILHSLADERDVDLVSRLAIANRRGRKAEQLMMLDAMTPRGYFGEARVAHLTVQPEGFPTLAVDVSVAPLDEDNHHLTSPR